MMIEDEVLRFRKWKEENKIDYNWGRSGRFFRDLLWPCWQKATKPYIEENKLLKKENKELKELLNAKTIETKTI